MKKLIVFISALLISIMSFAATITVVSPGIRNDIRANVLTAVAAASKGDTIKFPAGVDSFTVSSTITITKMVHLKGASTGTILYRDESVSDATLAGWETMIHYNINSNVSSKIDISGITFRSQIPEIVAADGGSLAIDIGLKITNCVDFKVHNCTFKWFGNAGLYIKHRDYLARGLVYSNTFIRNAKGADAQGYAYGVVLYGEGLKWVASPNFGSQNFIFIEDNTFDYHRHSVAAGACALYVFRYNTVTNNILGANNSVHAVDMHGPAGGTLGSENYFGSRAIEVYNNSIINTKYFNGTTIHAPPALGGELLIEVCIFCGGGDAVIHDNTIQGYRFGVGVEITGNPWSDAYPRPYRYKPGYLSYLKYGPLHTGMDSEHGNGDVFVWSNSFSVYDAAYCVLFYNYDYTSGAASEPFVENRDYHQSSNSSKAKPNYRPFPYPHPRR